MELKFDYILDRLGGEESFDLVSNVCFGDRGLQLYYWGEHDARRRVKFDGDVVAALRGNRFDQFEVLNRRGEDVFASREFYHLPAREISFEQEFENWAGQVERLTSHPAFTSAMLGDEDDRLWQGQRKISRYRQTGRPYEHLPRTVDRRGREVIDVSGNSGRLRETLGMRLWAGAQVWFGPAADAIVGLDRVRSLPVGEVSELSGGRVHVRLFEVGDPMGEVREKQRIFEEWLRFDELEARREELLAAYNAGELY